SGARVLAFGTFPYPPALRRRVFELFDPRTSRVDAICRMNFALGEVFARALVTLARRSRIPLASIDLIGSHGQTIHHLPGGAGGRRGAASTLQIAEPSVIAERTGITTVADFRPRDIAAGGQGAPLVPWADYVLFRHRRRSRAVQNIGGIANVTYLPAACRLADVVAFDTGPGNMVIDRIAQRATAGRRRFDAGGRLARRGQVHRGLLAGLMRHPFLRRRPPKTTGRETFGVAFADALYARARAEGIAPRDILTTVTAFTARSIAQGYRRFLPAPPDEVILCGGGARNSYLVDLLRRELAPAAVRLTDELGINADAKEALSFALLAAAAIRGQANNVPSATGARHAVVCGKIVPGRRVP
ncbi:MAG: anhydro-N-acetylmuramic acid kinase, partial [Phycisphaerae bacterium]|nr:anhydro-N-acetylmuramic acid kinase [Phycisphaerae bacterium]